MNYQIKSSVPALVVHFVYIFDAIREYRSYTKSNAVVELLQFVNSRDSVGYFCDTHRREKSRKRRGSLYANEKFDTSDDAIIINNNNKIKNAPRISDKEKYSYIRHGKIIYILKLKFKIFTIYIRIIGTPTLQLRQHYHNMY